MQLGVSKLAFNFRTHSSNISFCEELADLLFYDFNTNVSSCEPNQQQQRHSAHAAFPCHDGFSHAEKVASTESKHIFHDYVATPHHDLFDIFDILLSTNKFDTVNECIVVQHVNISNDFHCHAEHQNQNQVDTKEAYRKRAIAKWLQKRAKRTTSYKVKIASKNVSSQRCTSTGKFVKSAPKFISVTDL